MCTSQDIADRVHAEFSAAKGKLLCAITELQKDARWKDRPWDLATYLAGRWQISNKTARALVRESLALVPRKALREALSRGEISADQCTALTTLSEEWSDDVAVWLECLPTCSITDLEREARKKRARDLERDDGGVYLRAEYTRDERYLKGSFQLHPDEGAALLAGIDARVASGTPLARIDRARADALVELAKGGGAQTTVLVSIDAAEDVARAGDGYVSPQTAKRLSCDAAVQPLYKDGDGRITGYGRTSRTVPPHLRRAVYQRDNGICVFPGCEKDFFLECHHIIHYADGGPTELFNLLLLCWNHHKFLHEGEWSVRGPAGPDITWIQPDGTTYEPRVRVSLDTS